jgi:hypothetical protein
VSRPPPQHCSVYPSPPSLPSLYHPLPRTLLAWFTAKSERASSSFTTFRVALATCHEQRRPSILPHTRPAVHPTRASSVRAAVNTRHLHHHRPVPSFHRHPRRSLRVYHPHTCASLCRRVTPTHHPHGCEVSRPPPQHCGVYPSPPSLSTSSSPPPHLLRLAHGYVRVREQQLHHLHVALPTGNEQRRDSTLQCTLPEQVSVRVAVNTRHLPPTSPPCALLSSPSPQLSPCVPPPHLCELMQAGHPHTPPSWL